MTVRGRLFADLLRFARRSLGRLRIAQIPLVLAAVFGIPLVLVLLSMARQHWVNANDDFRSAGRMREASDVSHLLHLLACRSDLGLEPCPIPLSDHDDVLTSLDAEINTVLIRMVEVPRGPQTPQGRQKSFDPQPLVESLRILPSRTTEVMPRDWRDQHREALERVAQAIAARKDDRRHHTHPSTATSALSEFLSTRMPAVVIDLDTALDASHTPAQGGAAEAQRWVFLSALERARMSCEGVTLARQRAESILPPFALRASQEGITELPRETLEERFAQLQNIALSEGAWPPGESDRGWRELAQLRRDLERFTHDSITFVERVLQRHAVESRWTALVIGFTTLVAIGTIVAVMLAWRWRLLKSLHAIQNIAKTSPAEPAGSLNELDSLNDDLVPILRDRQRMASLLQTSANRAQEAAARAVLAERNARQLEEQIDLMTSSSQDGLWDWDVRSDYVFYSPQVWKMLGYRPENMPQMSFAAFSDQIHPDDRSMVHQARHDHLDRRVAYMCEFRLKAINGEYLWFHERGHAKWDSNGRPIRMVGTLRDVTERRLLVTEQEKFVTDLQISRDEIATQAMQLQQQTEELTAARERAEIAARSKGEFLANISHELRTPLTAILGYADLLQDEGDQVRTSQNRLEMIQTIRSNGTHLLQLIDDILDLSNIEAGRMTIEFVPCRPEEILDQLKRLLALQTKSKGLEFDVRARGLLPAMFLSDPKRLRQILVNLLGNAIKFTELGRITLELSADQGAEGTIRFSVMDTGIGMSSDQVSRLYQSFDQVDASSSRRFGGTGLGLAISQRLAGLLGGEITVISELGRGSAFTVTLNATVPPGTEWRELSTYNVSAPSLPVQPGRMTGARILVADDLESDRRLAAFVLNQAGAKVTFANNGADAVHTVAKARGRHEPFHLVLMDMQTPGFGGDNAVRQLRAEGYRGPIVAMTGRIAPEDCQQCLDAGCNVMLPKPVDRTHLLEVCTRAFSVGTSTEPLLVS